MMLSEALRKWSSCLPLRYHVWPPCLGAELTPTASSRSLTESGMAPANHASSTTSSVSRTLAGKLLECTDEREERSRSHSRKASTRQVEEVEIQRSRNESERSRPSTAGRHCSLIRHTDHAAVISRGNSAKHSHPSSSRQI